MRSLRPLSTVAVILTCCALPGLSSCSSHPPGWRAALARPPTHPVAGAWVGTWRSTATGHTGTLRCLAEPESGPAAAGAEESWILHYRATWAGILRGGYSVECVASSPKPGVWRVRGGHDLGRWFGGPFTHTGIITGNTFHADYSSSLDSGVMEMTRPSKH